MSRVGCPPLAACFAVLILLPAPALSQSRDSSEPDGKNKKEWSGRWGRSSGGVEGDEGSRVTSQYDVDPRTAKKLTTAREFTVSEEYDEADATLDRLRERSLNPLEKAKTYQIRAYIAYGRNDLATARDFLEKTIEQEVLPQTEVADIRYQIAQLWFADENWTEGAKNLEIWFTIEPDPNPSSHHVLALAYYQLGDFDKALARSTQAVEASDEPREDWLQLLLALRLTNQQYEEAIPILEELAERFPKKSHWLSLSTVYGALGNYEEALIPLQLAHTKGLLTTDAEMRRLAQLLLFLGLPYRAALVLEQGLDTGVIEADDAEAWEMLSNSLIGAREYEKATEPLEHAARLAADGSLYVRLAQVHIQRERWREAAGALRDGLAKGLDEPGQAFLLMGIALHSQKNPRQARGWFTRARKHDDASDEAKTWLRYIDRELASG